VYLGLFFEPAGLPLGFAVRDCPLGYPVSGSFVSTIVPGRDNDLPRVGLSDEATEIVEESATEMGETPSINVGLMGLLETGTSTPSPEEPALSATGIGVIGEPALSIAGIAWSRERLYSASISRIKDVVANEGDEIV